MSFSPFPYQGYYRVFDSNQEFNGGSFVLTDSMDLKHIVAQIFIRGSLAGSEQLRLKVYGNDSTASSSTPIAVSSWASLADIGAYTGNWVGDIFFDFSGEPLKSGVTYYISAQPQNYTRNLDSFYIGMNLDWYAPVNTQLSATESGIRARILGYK